MDNSPLAYELRLEGDMLHPPMGTTTLLTGYLVSSAGTSTLSLSDDGTISSLIVILLFCIVAIDLFTLLHRIFSPHA